jgi:hypothetical protein
MAKSTLCVDSQVYVALFEGLVLLYRHKEEGEAEGRDCSLDARSLVLPNTLLHKNQQLIFNPRLF